MPLHSFAFLFAFLPVSAAVFAGAPRVMRPALLLLCSSVFLLLNGLSTFLWFCAMAGVTLAIGSMLALKKTVRFKKLLLLSGIVLNTVLLLLFRSGCDVFFNCTQFTFFTGMPGIGVSFLYLFTVSFLVEQYRNAEEQPYMHGLLYMSFFPIIISGPILAYADFRKQITAGFYLKKGEYDETLMRIVRGLGKKLILAHFLAPIADGVFNADVTSLTAAEAWYGLTAFTFQIYFDFSAYSDIAIGVAQLFGIRVPENFNAPYLSTSVTDFWRRWHMSFFAWLKTHIYIPLGGNRKGAVRTFFAIFMVFLVSGLWHGTQLHFIAWGTYFGLIVCVERMMRGLPISRLRILGIPYTLLAVSIGWVFFRSATLDYALTFIGVLMQIINLEQIRALLLLISGGHMPLFAVCVFIIFIAPFTSKFRFTAGLCSLPARYAFHLFLFVVATSFLRVLENESFLYGQF